MLITTRHEAFAQIFGFTGGESKCGAWKVWSCLCLLQKCILPVYKYQSDWFSLRLLLNTLSQTNPCYILVNLIEYFSWRDTDSPSDTQKNCSIRLESFESNFDTFKHCYITPQEYVGVCSRQQPHTHTACCMRKDSGRDLTHTNLHVCKRALSNNYVSQREATSPCRLHIMASCPLCRISCPSCKLIRGQGTDPWSGLHLLVHRARSPQ